MYYLIGFYGEITGYSSQIVRGADARDVLVEIVAFNIEGDEEVATGEIEDHAEKATVTAKRCYQPAEEGFVCIEDKFV